jgi:enoyl-CoA hydratase/carnithine racemase
MQLARRPFKDHQARGFLFETSENGRVATIRLNRPERKNPLTFDSYAELRDLFRDLACASDVRAVVLTGAGGNFSSPSEAAMAKMAATESTQRVIDRPSRCSAAEACAGRDRRAPSAPSGSTRAPPRRKG